MFLSSTMVIMMTGMSGGAGIGFERGEHRPAVHAGHHHVEGDDGGLELLSRVRGRAAVGGGYDTITVFGERALHEVAHAGVVVDDEHGGVRARARNADGR